MTTHMYRTLKYIGDASFVGRLSLFNVGFVVYAMRFRHTCVLF